MPRLAVVIPVLHDSDAVRALLADLPPSAGIELVIADAGGDAGLNDVLSGAPHVRRIQSPAGRGVQLNAGAAASSSDLILFLHADSRLPAGWDDALLTLPSSIAGGWFRFALDDEAWQARVLERVVGWRVQLFRLPYGDQGIFVRRSVFDRMNGFRPWPLMEDVDFVRRLAREGPVLEVPLPLKTSSRRWRRDGWFKRSARNVVVLTLYLAGVPPARLARWYSGPPGPPPRQ